MGLAKRTLLNFQEAKMHFDGYSLKIFGLPDNRWNFYAVQ